jgi:pimeloyl-ACP methyl ester carboxylesterase
MSKTMSTARTSIRVEGAGPTVICLHASASSSKQWQPLSERLRPGYRVLAPDLYGYGTSFACDTGRPCSLDDEAALIEPLLDGTPQGVYLVGHSYGAAVALKLALTHRERIRGLVLYEPTLFGLLFAEKPAHRAAMEIGAARLTIRRYLRAGKPFPAAQRFVDYWSGEGAWRSLPPSQQEAIAQRMPTVLANLDTLLADATPLSEYARIEAPVLYLTGVRTRASAQCVAQILTRALPSAEWRQLPGAGHMGPLSHAEEVNYLIQGFLAVQRGGAASGQSDLGATAELAWAV